MLALERRFAGYPGLKAIFRMGRGRAFFQLQGAGFARASFHAFFALARALALRKFTDLMDGALIAAAEAPRFELRALARHLGLSAEETAQNPVAILPALQEALCQRFAQLPRRLLVLLDYVRGAETALSWLPWPELEIDERRAAFAQLGYLAPARTRPAASSGEALFGECAGTCGRAILARKEHWRKPILIMKGAPAAIAMARSVAEALEEGGVLIIEAGTGVGKSLAYLAPAIL